jgi:hypothetical protein
MPDVPFLKLLFMTSADSFVFFEHSIFYLFTQFAQSLRNVLVVIPYKQVLRQVLGEMLRRKVAERAVEGTRRCKAMAGRASC